MLQLIGVLQFGGGGGIRLDGLSLDRPRASHPGTEAGAGMAPPPASSILRWFNPLHACSPDVTSIMSHPTDEIPEPVPTGDGADPATRRSRPDVDPADRGRGTDPRRRPARPAATAASRRPTPSAGPEPAPARAAGRPPRRSTTTTSRRPNWSGTSSRSRASREDTIRDALERRVKIQGLQRFFGRIVVPTEKITEIRNNKKRIVERKTYPGYIMVEMELNEKTWFTVRETPGVGDFVGAHGTPTKMTEAEVNQMLHQEEEKTDRRDPQGPHRRRARRPRQDQGRPVRELRGDRRGSHRGPRPGQGHADHLQPAHAGRPRILAGGTDLTRSGRHRGRRVALERVGTRQSPATGH